MTHNHIVFAEVATHEIKQLVEQISCNGIPEYAVKVYEARNRIFYITLKSGLKVNIKEYHTPTFPNNLIYGHLRKSKAQRAFEMALYLKKHGIDTPAPIAYSEQRAIGGRLQLSYFFSIHIDNVSEARQWGNPEEEIKFSQSLSTVVSQLSSIGFLNMDFTPGNILWSYDASSGTYHFHLIDINRAKIKARPLTTTELARMLRATGNDINQTSLLAQFTAEQLGLSTEDFIMLIRKQYKRFISHKTRHRKIKRILRRIIIKPQ